VDPAVPPTTLETLDRDECVRLLAGRQLGRLAFLQGADLVVLPVNYATDGDVVVFRTDTGAKLEGTPLERVAFEVDAIDPVTHEGWSVLVQGVGEELRPDHGALYERVRSLPLAPWAPGRKEHVVRVVPTRITGRRLSRPG
jgi:nitroimidazol reductase NimA-like FMN-containing flavoprotein (pyridoxamine 5'-phosphate oxidase superfamily)